MDSPEHCLVAGYPADTEAYFRLWPPALDEETCYLSHVCVVTRRAPANLLLFPPGWLYPRLRSSWGLTTLACRLQPRPHAAARHPSRQADFLWPLPP